MNAVGISYCTSLSPLPSRRGAVQSVIFGSLFDRQLVDELRQGSAPYIVAAINDDDESVCWARAVAIFDHGEFASLMAA